jgi:hypothetical protein
MSASTTSSTIDPGSMPWSVVLPASSWAVGPRRRWFAAGADAGPDGANLRAARYVAVPSVRSPLLVAAYDRDVLRHVAQSVLSVPPGSGPFTRAVLTVALRGMRLRPSWRVATLAGVVRVVPVRRRP